MLRNKAQGASIPPDIKTCSLVSLRNIRLSRDSPASIPVSSFTSLTAASARDREKEINQICTTCTWSWVVRWGWTYRYLLQTQQFLQETSTLVAEKEENIRTLNNITWATLNYLMLTLYLSCVTNTSSVSSLCTSPRENSIILFIRQ